MEVIGRRVSGYLSVIALLLMTTPAWSLALGQLNLHSYLNQPLKATVPLIALNGVNLEDIHVRLASDDDFQRLDIERSALLNQMTFTVMKETEGSPIIAINSKEPLAEPFLLFLLDVTWPDGHMVREYTLLLDPVTAPPTLTPPVMNETSKNLLTTSGKQIQHDARTFNEDNEEAAGEDGLGGSPTESVVVKTAKKPSDNSVGELPSTQSQQPKIITPASSVVTVKNKNRSSAKEGYAIKTPLSLQEEKSTVHKTTTGLASQSQTVQLGEQWYGTTTANDNAWEIARHLHHVHYAEHASLAQVMVALLKRNPHAFNHDNINGLRSGETLVIPSIQDINAVNAKDAQNLLKNQNMQWKNRVLISPHHNGDETTSHTQSPAVHYPSQLKASPIPAQTFPTKIPKEGSLMVTNHPNVFDVAAMKALEKELSVSVASLNATKETNSALLDDLNQLQEDNERLKNQLAHIQQQLRILQQQKNTELKDNNKDVESVTRVIQQTGTPSTAIQPGIQVGHMDIPASESTSWYKYVWALFALVACGLAGLYWRRWQLSRLDPQGVKVDEFYRYDAKTTANDSFDQQYQVSMDQENKRTEENNIRKAITATPKSTRSSSSNEQTSVDPMEAFTVYLSYERYQLALGSLLIAIESHPQRMDLQIALLDLYRRMHDKVAFDAAATEIKPHLNQLDPELKKQYEALMKVDWSIENDELSPPNKELVKESSVPAITVRKAMGSQSSIKAVSIAKTKTPPTGASSRVIEFDSPEKMPKETIEQESEQLFSCSSDTFNVNKSQLHVGSTTESAENVEDIVLEEKNL